MMANSEKFLGRVDPRAPTSMETRMAGPGPGFSGLAHNPFELPDRFRMCISTNQPTSKKAPVGQPGENPRLTWELLLKIFEWHAREHSKYSNGTHATTLKIFEWQTREHPKYSSVNLGALVSYRELVKKRLNRR